MNQKAAEILLHPPPCGHIVYPYTEDWQLIDAVAFFAGAGLENGEAVVLVMTKSHSEPVLSRLAEAGFNVPALTRSGQIIYNEAETLLASFLFDGIIDEHKFKTRVSKMIKLGKLVGREHRVRVFGEMVSLIWQPLLRATERLEELWNQVIEQESVPLLCAYALSGTRIEAFPESLLACHSHRTTTS